MLERFYKMKIKTVLFAGNFILQSGLHLLIVINELNDCIKCVFTAVIKDEMYEKPIFIWQRVKLIENKMDHKIDVQICVCVCVYVYFYGTLLYLHCTTVIEKKKKKKKKGKKIAPTSYQTATNHFITF